MILNLPGQAQCEFKLRLAASPSRSDQFGPWHLADRVVAAIDGERNPRQQTMTPSRSAIGCFSRHDSDPRGDPSKPADARRPVPDRRTIAAGGRRHGRAAAALPSPLGHRRRPALAISVNMDAHPGPAKPVPRHPHRTAAHLPVRPRLLYARDYFCFSERCNFACTHFLSVPERVLHVRISPDPDFRHPSGPPPARSDRQFSSGERIHRRQATRSRHQQRRPRLRRARPVATISNLPDRCTRRFRWPAAICPATTTSATTRPEIGPPPSAAGHRTATADVSHALRRGPLALRCRRLVLHRPQFAADEYGPCERGRTVRLACLAALRAPAASRSRCSCTSRCS